MKDSKKKLVKLWKVSERYIFNQSIVRVNIRLKVFPGRRKFFCDGRFHSSRNWYAILGISGIMVAAGVVHAVLEYNQKENIK